MSRKLAAILGFSFFAILFIGCGQAPDLDTYYPTKEGMKRTTQGKTTMTSGTEEIQEEDLKASIIYLPAQELQGKTVFPMRSNRIGKQKDISFLVYLGKDQEGIYVVATQITINKKIHEPKFMERKDYLLKKPLKVGTEWSIELGSYLISPEKVQMKVTIDSLDESISVPAGTFNKCIKIIKKGSVTLKNGADIKKEQILWYAPRVGFVKFIDRETMTENGQTKMKKMLTQLETIDE